ncbi:glycine zipper domain-containing protein [Asticcacaulis sp. EMRT-3]|uniref:glycine zipper domain-containing protein n=1 Tax=Asticcacaulis sp. EMRT-3 TaxID=3040349 RepID=UPI0024AE9C2D|nr:glycine zipper domain-containing protein [Asticcacaulis sp. EMRT-3]MDI7774145.1 glycine zipper domain-containing protein [Asticcacaulis sp. EMRT-3]
MIHTSFRTLVLGAGAAALTLGALAPVAAMAAPSRYDGYCYAKKTDLAGQNAAIGAAAGALAGGLLGKKGDKTKSAIIGGAVGGAAGYVVGKNSHEKVRCSKGVYYVYKNGYYEPGNAPRGYRVVFFEDRPANVDAYYISKGKTYRYKGR